MTGPADPRVLVSGLHFPECPRWRAGRLWVSDLHGHRVLSIDRAGDVRVEAVVPHQPGGLGWLPDGRLLVVSMVDRRVLRREADGSLVVHADLSHLAGDHLNDMVVDASGGAFVTQFGFPLRDDAEVVPSPIIRVGAGGDARIVGPDLLFANGAAITPDGSTLLVAESFGSRVTRLAIGPEGDLGDARPWAELGAACSRGTTVGEAAGAVDAMPDGIALDADGALWVADAKGGRALRVAPGGDVLEVVEVDSGLYGVALGGVEGRTLFLCCAPSASPRRQAQHTDGVVLATEVGTPAATVEAAA